MADRRFRRCQAQPGAHANDRRCGRRPTHKVVRYWLGECRRLYGRDMLLCTEAAEWWNLPGIVHDDDGGRIDPRAVPR